MADPTGTRLLYRRPFMMAVAPRPAETQYRKKLQTLPIVTGGSAMGRAANLIWSVTVVAVLAWAEFAGAQRIEFDEVLIERNGRQLERVEFPDETAESISFIVNLPNAPQNFRPGTVVLIEPPGEPAGSGVPCLGGQFSCSDAIQISPSPFFDTQILVNFFSDPSAIPGGFMVQETGFLQDVTEFFLIDPTRPAPFEVFIGSDVQAVATSEPATLLLMGVGIAALVIPIWQRS